MTTNKPYTSKDFKINSLALPAPPQQLDPKLIEDYSAQLYRAIMQQREEIVIAFMAKYKLQPGEVIQVFGNNKWFVRKMTRAEANALKGIKKTNKPCSSN